MRPSRAAALWPVLVDAAAVLGVWGVALSRRTSRSAFSGASSSRGPGRSRQARHVVGPIAIGDARARWPWRRRPRGGSRFERGAGGARRRDLLRGGRGAARRARLGARRHARAGTSRAGARARRSSWRSPLAGVATRPMGRPRAGRWRAVRRARRARSRAGSRVLARRRVRPAAPLSGVSRGAAGRLPARRRARRRSPGAPVRPRRAGHPRHRRGRRAWSPSSALRGHAEGDADARGRLEPSHRPRRARAADGPGRDLRDGAAAARPRRPPRTTALAAAAPGEVARSLDWSGHDLVLISVDALRADHVSAYGYARPTTPEPRRAGRRGDALRARVLPDAAHVVLAHVDDDGQVPAAAPGARPRRGLGDLGAVPPSLRLAHRRVLSAGGLLHRRGPLPALRGGAPGLRVREGRVRRSGPARAAGRASTSTPRRATVRCFSWVHFFEPHEPYVVHPEHVFTGGPSADVDAYDSEVADRRRRHRPHRAPGAGAATRARSSS